MFSAVILAAGEAKRMGTLKQLLPWGESTILETVITNVSSCHYIDDEIRVIVGAESERIISVLSKWNKEELKVIKNPDYKTGMLSSVWRGLEALPQKTEYVVFVLGDQPLIPTRIFNRVIEKYLDLKPEIIVPIYQGQRGHPIVINKKLLPEVYKLTGPGGLRSLIQKQPEKVYFYEIDDKRITIDLDYYEEYQKYKKLWKK